MFSPTNKKQLRASWPQQRKSCTLGVILNYGTVGSLTQLQVLGQTAAKSWAIKPIEKFQQFLKATIPLLSVILRSQLSLCLSQVRVNIQISWNNTENNTAKQRQNNKKDPECWMKNQFSVELHHTCQFSLLSINLCFRVATVEKCIVTAFRKRWNSSCWSNSSFITGVIDDLKKVNTCLIPATGYASEG